jgi:hypothetical protein
MVIWWNVASKKFLNVYLKRKEKRKKKKQYPVEVSTWLVGCAKIPKFDTASLLPCFLGNLI